MTQPASNLSFASKKQPKTTLSLNSKKDQLLLIITFSFFHPKLNLCQLTPIKQNHALGCITNCINKLYKQTLLPASHYRASYGG